LQAEFGLGRFFQFNIRATFRSLVLPIKNLNFADLSRLKVRNFTTCAEISALKSTFLKYLSDCFNLTDSNIRLYKEDCLNDVMTITLLKNSVLFRFVSNRLNYLQSRK